MELRFENEREKSFLINHDILTRQIYDELKPWGIRNQAMGELMGNPRQNCTYPDNVLKQRGAKQSLPIMIEQPFKWLMREPMYLDLGDSNKQYMFLHAQYEGGTD